MQKQHEYVNELTDGMSIKNATFIVLDKSSAVTKNQSPYLMLTVGDNTGSIACRYWDVPSNVVQRTNVGDGIIIVGTIQTFRNERQIRIEKCKPFVIDAESINDFISSPCAHAAEDMTADLNRIIQSVGDGFLKLLLMNIFGDDKLRVKYMRVAAASKNHHAWPHGLAFHSLTMASMADHLAKLQPAINRDILIVGALLHDIGKTVGYTTDPIAQLTMTERLHGHAINGAMIVRDYIDAIPDFPRELRMRLLHLIISHHGQATFGTGIRPQTIEAVALHHLDFLDAATQAAIDCMHTSSGRWSNWCRMLDTKLLMPPEKEM